MYEQPSSKYGILIRIDQDLRDHLEQIRQPGESLNDVCRRALGLPPKKGESR